MSVNDIKARCADVPGIQNLTMTLESGRIKLSWGTEGYTAATDAAASNHDIETAIRNAIKLAPVASIPDKPVAGTPLPDVSPVIAPAPATPATTGQPMTTTPSTAAGAVQDLMGEHVRLMRDIHAASIETLRASLARQRDAMTGAVVNVAGKVDRQTDDFLAAMGQFTNDLGSF